MRYWHLLCASFCASVASVFSFVIPYCLFLNFQQNHLLHMVSNAMQVEKKDVPPKEDTSL